MLMRARSLGLDESEIEIVLSLKSESAERIEFIGRLIVSANALTPAIDSGTVLLRQLPDVPLWTGNELSFEHRTIKRFRRPARNQQMVLAVFQEEGWPRRIDNPIPADEKCDAQLRLHDSIKSLNRNHILDPSPIRFRGDGTGTGVIWEIVVE